MFVAEAPGAVDGALAATLRRRILVPVSAAFAVLIAVCAAGVRIPEALQYAPFVISLVAFGLPHGALDHLVPARLAGRAPTLRSIGGVVLLYAVLGAAVMAAWALAPAAAFVGFIAITWFHWGQGDLYVLLALDRAGYLCGSYKGQRMLRAAAITVRGALPMLVPLIAFPAVYAGVATAATTLFDPAAAGQLTAIIDPTVRAALAVGFAVLVVGYAVVTGVLAQRAGADSPRAWRRDLLEIVVLTAFFAVVPPVLAIGLYFCLWHAVRHIIRLEMLDEEARGSLRRGRLLPVAARFARDAAPITVIALVILVLFFVLLPPASGAGASLGVYLVLISALTLPHIVIVSLMDRRQQLWR